MKSIPEIYGGPVILGYSGGPDAAALAYRLQSKGTEVIPVYIDYRKTAGGKSAKDQRHARESAKILGLQEPLVVSKLLDRPKSRRNRFFVEVLSGIAGRHREAFVALGTLREKGDEDLDPNILDRVAIFSRTRIVTWDTFGVSRKFEQFRGMIMNEVARRAMFATTSCQMWWKIECGNCYSCIARHEAFMQAFGHDKTQYRKGSTVGR